MNEKVGRLEIKRVVGIEANRSEVRELKMNERQMRRNGQRRAGVWMGGPSDLFLKITLQHHLTYR